MENLENVENCCLLPSSSHITTQKNNVDANIFTKNGETLCRTNRLFDSDNASFCQSIVPPTKIQQISNRTDFENPLIEEQFQSNSNEKRIKTEQSNRLSQNGSQRNQKQYFVNTKLAIASNLVKRAENNGVLGSEFFLPPLPIKTIKENSLDNTTSNKLILN